MIEDMECFPSTGEQFFSRAIGSASFNGPCGGRRIDGDSSGSPSHVSATPTKGDDLDLDSYIYIIMMILAALPMFRHLIRMLFQMMIRRMFLRHQSIPQCRFRLQKSFHA